MVDLSWNDLSEILSNSILVLVGVFERIMKPHQKVRDLGLNSILSQITDVFTMW